VTTSYPFARLRADLAADLEAYLDFAAEYSADRRTFLKRLSALLTPSGLVCALYRLSHWAHARGLRRLSMAIALCNLFVTRASVAPASQIGGGLYVPHPSTGIVFQGTAGRNLRLFAGCAVAAYATPLHGGELARAPLLGENVSVGAKAFVAGGVRVGDGARIGFNAFVERDVPAGAVVVSAHVRNRGRPRDH
jgi:serine O-acetyltransferase